LSLRWDQLIPVNKVANEKEKVEKGLEEEEVGKKDPGLLPRPVQPFIKKYNVQMTLQFIHCNPAGFRYTSVACTYVGSYVLNVCKYLTVSIGSPPSVQIIAKTILNMY
jgi:hypothetical protein